MLVAEILSTNVRSDETIRGTISSETKIVQYADDTTGIFRDVLSAKNFLYTLNRFATCSGLKLNIEKTEAMWLGADKMNKNKPLGINWPDKPIKLLGLYIGHNKKDLEISNFRHKINKMKQMFYAWSQRDLTLIGRILIIKSLAISLFVHLANLVIFPNDMIIEIESLRKIT